MQLSQKMKHCVGYKTYIRNTWEEIQMPKTRQAILKILDIYAAVWN